MRTMYVVNPIFKRIINADLSCQETLFEGIARSEGFRGSSYWLERAARSIGNH